METIDQIKHKLEKIEAELSEEQIRRDTYKNGSHISTSKEEREGKIKNFDYKINQLAEIKTKLETQLYSKKSMVIACDFTGEKEVNVNIHVIVGGEAKETYNVPHDISQIKNMDDFWSVIGKEIHDHMNNNPDYYPFGS